MRLTPILLSVVSLEMFGEFVSLGKLVLTILAGIAETSHMGLGVISQPGLGGVEMTASLGEGTEEHSRPARPRGADGA